MILFDASRIRLLLRGLMLRLEEHGVPASIHVVGGSALALRYPADPEVRVTRDIDAVLRPRRDIAFVASQMADEHGLEPGWLNSNAAAFVPPRSSSTTERDAGGVTVATDHELIAMKLAAGRDRDLFDLGILARHADLHNPGDLVEIAFRFYGEDSVVLNESRADYLLLATQALDHAKRRRRQPRSARP